jgi:FtsP/CotA-like multicopper oxidase with cupredoxin domain
MLEQARAGSARACARAAHGSLAPLTFRARALSVLPPLPQYVDGLFGALIVRARPGSPEAPPAHTDELTLMISDFYSASAHTLLASFYLTPLSGGNEPVPDALTVNGLFSTTLAGAAPAEQLFVGVAARTGTTLFHVVAANAFSMFAVSIDGVNLQIVEVDATAVRPLTVPRVTLNVAQRVSFLVEWATLPAAYANSSVFLRVSAMDDMFPFDVMDAAEYPAYSNAAAGFQPLDVDFVGVLQFSPVAAGRVAPAYNATAPLPAPAPAIVNTGAYAATDVTQLDTNLLDARPVLAVPMPAPTHHMHLEVAFYPDSSGVNRAHFNGLSHVHDMMMGGVLPALYKHTGAFDPALGVGEAPAALTFSAATPAGHGAGNPPPATAIRYSPEAHYVLPPDAVVSVFINNTDTGEHPFHVHGHSFWVTASSAHPSAEAAFAGNPSRRDVVSVEAGGWVKIVFVADNPGVWALHCHIDWHLAVGLMASLFLAQAPP